MEKNTILFYQLVQIFQASAMQGLGKMVNPSTNQMDKSLEQASVAIDLLGMIKEKTKGNLSSEEENMLNTILNNLRLNYVDEMNNAKTVEEKPQESEPKKETKKSSKKSKASKK